MLTVNNHLRKARFYYRSFRIKRTAFWYLLIRHKTTQQNQNRHSLLLDHSSFLIHSSHTSLLTSSSLLLTSSSLPPLFLYSHAARLQRITKPDLEQVPVADAAHASQELEAAHHEPHALAWARRPRPPHAPC